MTNKTEIILNIDNPLFEYIKPLDNDEFSKMKNKDLKEILYYMKDYYLILRNRLGFNDDVTFGLELEFENANKGEIVNLLNMTKLNKEWFFKNDGSLNNGSEINSPILKDTYKSWNDLKKVCNIVSSFASISLNSAGHIHIGTQVIGGKINSWLNFIKLWSTYENVIFRFLYGEFLTPRPKITNYASPMMIQLMEDYAKLNLESNLQTKDIVNQIRHRRRQAINFYNVHNFDKITLKNTIEFRSPNGTLDPVIWQNNLDLLVNILLYSKSDDYNDDIVSRRKYENEYKYLDIKTYNEIYLDQALELCDMLYSNNYDKIYFLKQYLKSFEVGKSDLEKAKVFTKKKH